ncbi:MAG: response regulator [Planctomycetota bacterium]|nr:response regulator [Planctomycetota bacterium]
MSWKPILKQNYRQLIFIWLAFLALAAVGYFFAGRMMRAQLTANAHEMLRTIEANIRTSLHQPEAALTAVAFAVRTMLDRGAPQGEILEYLLGITDWYLAREENLLGFNGLYGIVRGEYLDGLGWNPPADYVPSERPWHRVALEKTGEVGISQPYIDAETGQPVVSIALASMREGEYVVALDVLLRKLSAYVTSVRLAEGGYGFLLDKNLAFIAHPNPRYAGKPLRQISPEHAVVADKLQTATSVDAWLSKTPDGTEYVIFLRRNNEQGWYIGLATPVASYYSDVRRLALTLTVAGLILVLALSAVVMRLRATQARAEEKSRAKTVFLARMSHEIRTPMNAILGMSELALRDYGTPAARDCIRDIKVSGENLLAIINDILDFSKAESGNFTINPAAYAAASLFNDVLVIIRMRLAEKNLDFITAVAPEIPATLVGDVARVRQVLLNVLSNAVKYTASGFIKFAAACDFLTSGKARLTFVVGDSGVGIKPEDLPNLFGDFVRVDEKANVGIEGAGLGLAIARQLCRRMGGDITVESVYGKGSVFTATLIQNYENNLPLGNLGAHAVAEKSGSARFTMPTARVLIVDDIATNLKIVQGLLAPFAMRFDVANSGRQAIDLARRNAYDLILMDHMMPEMDGIEATRQIRKLGNESRKVPIIALTANAVAGMREVFLSHGFNGYLSKPIELDKLNAVVENWIPRAKRVAPRTVITPSPPTDAIVAPNTTNTTNAPRPDATRPDVARPENPPADPLAGLAVALAGKIDVAAGLRGTGNKPAFYLDILDTYAEDAKARLTKLFAPATDAEWKSFITHVHALKSASASVGAAKISAAAKELENAGRGGDAAFIQANLPAFTTELAAVAAAISAALSSDKSPAPAESPAEPNAVAATNTRRLLLVDDNPTNLEVGRGALAEVYEVLTAPSAAQMFALLKQTAVDLILLDVDMPEMDGYAAIKILKNDEATRNIPVIFLSAQTDHASELSGLSLGALDYVSKPFSPPLLRKRLELHLRMNDVNNYLQTMVAEKTQNVTRLQNKILQTVANLVEYRDGETGDHIERTQRVLEILVRAMLAEGVYRAEAAGWDIDLLLQSSQLHDVGKIAIKDSILQKPGKLTAAEFEEMKKHARFGVDIVERIGAGDGSEFLGYAKIFAGAHHEKWDGTGYPAGLRGEEIPLLGRLMAIADVYDALTSERPYKKPFSHSEAVGIILDGDGKHFDPVLVRLFMRHKDELSAGLSSTGGGGVN